MSRTEIQSHPTRIKAPVRHEVVNLGGRRKLAGTKFHFIGAGGVGMSGLAQFLIEKKAVVTGSDQTATAITSRLSRMGATIHIGHHADHLPGDVDAVVVSAAIRDDNPELALALRRGCRVYKYAQMLGEVMNRYEGIAISGTHGKSTTSGWLVHSLKQAGVDANFVVGADIVQLGGSSGCGDSRFFVAEACEYDRSFLNLEPRIACLLNIERDHLDCYRDEAEIVEAFHQFVLGTKPDGQVVANTQDANVAAVASRLVGKRAVVTFGFDTRCNFCARNIREHDGLHGFDVLQNGQRLGTTDIALPGRHNVLNALAVVAMAASMGIEPKSVLDGLGTFKGMDRRLMLKGSFEGVTVLDDYAHHPTEVRASLNAIRQRYHPKRLWCVYQAHQYSRTRFFLDEFAASFAQADVTIVPEIYFVRDSQASRSEVNAEILAERIRRQGTEAQHIGPFDAVCDYLQQHVDAGDMVVTMGAGDVWKVADEYIRRLRTNH